MLTVHHLNNSRSQRVLWLLGELGVPYEIVRYQRQPDMRAPAELRAVHSLDALKDLCAALSGPSSAKTDPRRFLAAGLQ